jgi:hypothetical protein
MSSSLWRHYGVITARQWAPAWLPGRGCHPRPMSSLNQKKKGLLRLYGVFCDAHRQSNCPVQHMITMPPVPLAPKPLRIQYQPRCIQLDIASPGRSHTVLSGCDPARPGGAGRGIPCGSAQSLSAACVQWTPPCRPPPGSDVIIRPLRPVVICLETTLQLATRQNL